MVRGRRGLVEVHWVCLMPFKVLQKSVTCGVWVVILDVVEADGTQVELNG